MNKVVPAQAAKAQVREDVKATPSNYKGFVGGVFSGIAKLSVCILTLSPMLECVLITFIGRPPFRYYQSPLADFLLSTILWTP